MTKWEYTYIYLHLENGTLTLKTKSSTLIKGEILSFLNEKGRDGWQLVTVAQRVNNINPPPPSKAAGMMVTIAQGPVPLTPWNQAISVTVGYYLWFKRAIE